MAISVIPLSTSAFSFIMIETALTAPYFFDVGN